VAAKEETEIAGVRLSSPHKVLYPEQGTTKRDLAEYYLAVADHVLRHVARRPITLVRCPTGRQRKCFYQRHAGSGVPSELGEVEILGFEESGAYLFIKDVPGLIALVQMGVLEIHPWGARVDRPDRPERMIFDLDPGEGLGFGLPIAVLSASSRQPAGKGFTSWCRWSGGTRGARPRASPRRPRKRWPRMPRAATSPAYPRPNGVAASSSTTCATTRPRQPLRPTRRALGPGLP